MKKRLIPKYLAAILIWTGIYLGCGMVPDGWAKNTSLEELYQEKALALEQQGELQQALLAWRIAAGLNPDNTLTPKLIANLIKTIDTQAKQYFEQGRDYFDRGDFLRARQSFLITLHLLPGHKGALDYLEKQLLATDRKKYKVQPGDSYSKIAMDFYQDYTKAYAVAFFNDLNPEKPLLVGTQLVLPDLPDPYLISASSKARDQAQPSPDQKSSDRAAAPMKAEGADIGPTMDEANYQKGLDLMAKKQYADALAHFKRVSPEFSGRDQAIAKAQGLIKEQADKRALSAELKKAERLIGDKNYEAAQTLLEDILAKEPANIRARRLMDQARYAWAKELIAKQKEAQAIELLQKLDKAYQDTEDLLIQAKARLHARAESYYRRGVQHFLNEELESAIENWEKALSLNPNHPKARSDMENAMRLLKKWQDLNQDKPDSSENPKP